MPAGTGSPLMLGSTGAGFGGCAVALVGASVWLFAAVGVLLDRDDPPFLQAWLPGRPAPVALARLVVLFTLATLTMVVENRLRGFVITASLLALIRPEGGALALIAVGIMAIQNWRTPRRWLWLVIPVLAVGYLALFRFFEKKGL